MSFDRHRQSSNHIVPSLVISTETIKTLHKLELQAVRGQVIGLSFVAYHPMFRYTYDHTGVALRNPEFSIGAVYRLINEVSF